MNFEKLIKLLIALSILIYFFIGIFFIFFGEFHVDEGYYHLVPTLLFKNKLPYIDYLWVQTPLYPFVYAILGKLIGFSALHLRFISFILSLITAFIAIIFLLKNYNLEAVFLFISFAMLNPFQIYQSIIIKLYSLTGLFILLAIYFELSNKERKLRNYILTTIFLTLGVLTRFAVLGGLLFFLLLLLLKRNYTAFLICSLIAILLIIFVILPFAIKAPHSTYYGIIKYHLEKEAFNLFRQIVYKFDNLSRFLRYYFFLSMLIFSSMYIGIYEKGIKFIKDLPISFFILIGIILNHLPSQMPYMYEYLNVIVLSLALVIVKLFIETKFYKNYLKGRWEFISLIFLGSMMTIIGYGRERIPSPKPFYPIKYLNVVSREIEKLTEPTKPILTFNNSVAVQSHREVVEGDEMNVLTYSKDWPTEKCKKYHILNVEMLKSYIDKKIFGAMLITDDSFIGNFPVLFNPGEIGARPTIMRAINENYRLIKEYPNFGYFNKTAYLYVPKNKEREKDR